MTIGEYITFLGALSIRGHSFSPSNIGDDLRVSMTGNLKDPYNFEIPVYLSAYHRLYDNYSIVQHLKFLSSIYKSTASSILASFNRVRRVGELQKVATPKGEIYYGAPNIILNKELKALLCVTENKSTDNKRIIFRLSPSIFNSNGTIEKALVKFGIPAIADVLKNGKVYFRGEEYRSCLIIDDDVDKFLHIPAKPLINDDKENIIKNILLKDINSIL